MVVRRYKSRWKSIQWAAALLLAGCLLAPTSAVVAQGVPLPTFQAEVIDADIKIGYGTALGDVDGDGKLDIVVADKKQFAWYKNPGWKRYVIAENLTPLDNVCIAARDIDGDGKVEIAVGGQWNPGDTLNSGAVFYLHPPADRHLKWKAIRLPHEPTVHRMRWVKLSATEYTLVVAPLHGRGNRGGNGAGVKLLAYAKPSTVSDPWKTTVVDDSLHVTHNLDPCQLDPSTESEEILFVGREGALVLSYSQGKWNRRKLDRVKGGGEIRMGLHSATQPFIATIEPLHGSALVYYRSGYDRSAKSDIASVNSRIVLDDQLNAGHAIATGDFFGNGQQQVVAGWRSPNGAKKVGVKLYYPTDKTATTWKSLLVDDNGMATEDLRAGDLDGDGRLDIVAAGRATKNLKVYWNRSGAK
ncbi:MAG: FG-GAP and VCBS repeat-containing protein [Planctomycetota bacterium]|nr:FG-GAP and VCBS repeat-containing protein [Planctomycetota bacterium]